MRILRSLWARKVATVRDIHDDYVAADSTIAYTSIATIVRVMVDKGLAEIVDARRPQKFRALITQEDASKQVTDAWLEQMFDGSLANLFRHALTGRKVSAKEREELQALLKAA